MGFLERCLVIGAAGFLGAVARFGLSAAVQRIGPSPFPWGTVVVNAVACFAIGYLWSLGEHRFTLSPGLRAAIFVGFLGSFSTFSTYMFETMRMWDDHPGWAMGNLLLQNAAGLALTVGGYVLGRLD